MNILLIEGNIGDVYLIQGALDEIGLEYDIRTLHNGEAAIAYIKHYEESAVPDIIMLDINIPRKSGFEVLTELKKSEKLKEIPVIILTTSISDEDRETARELGAVGFVIKPPDYNEYTKQVQSVLNYLWN